jgi:hypothetical protein
VRTGALLGAMTGLTGIGVLAGFLTGNLTQPDLPTAAGAPKPLLTIPSPSPTPTPTVIVPSPDDPDGPPALDAEDLDYATRSTTIAGQMVRVRVPREWEIIPQSVVEVNVRYRPDGDSTFNVRVEAIPSSLQIDRASKEREAVLRGSGTLNLQILGRARGTVTTPDGLTRRYEELYYSRVEPGTFRTQASIVRWIAGIELVATGRLRDVDGLRSVLQVATKTIEVRKS